MDNTQQITCKILDFAKVPNTTIQIVSVQFTIGERQWNKAFRLNFDRAISMEEFKQHLIKIAQDEDPEHNIWPADDQDFLAHVKQESAQPFVIEVPKINQN